MLRSNVNTIETVSARNITTSGASATREVSYVRRENGAQEHKTTFSLDS